MTLYFTSFLSTSTQSILLLSFVQFNASFLFFVSFSLLIGLISHALLYFFLYFCFPSLINSARFFCGSCIVYHVHCFLHYRSFFFFFFISSWFAKVSHKLSHPCSCFFLISIFYKAHFFYFDQMRLPMVVWGIRKFHSAEWWVAFCWLFISLLASHSSSFASYLMFFVHSPKIKPEKLQQEKSFLFISLTLSCYFNVCDLLQCLPCFVPSHDFIFNLDKQNLFCDFVCHAQTLFLQHFSFRKKSIQYISFLVSSLFVIDLLKSWQ